MNVADATREVLWNVRHAWVMYGLFLVTLFVAGYGLFLRVRAWRRGQPTGNLAPWGPRWRRFFRHAILQQATWRDRFAGAFHAMIFWGFITLTIATTVVFLHHDFGIPIMRGRFYLYFQSLFVDWLGALAIVGTCLAAARRWAQRPRQLVYTDEASWILILVLLILVTGFLIEGWRIAVTQDPWGNWSPFGQLIATVSHRIMDIPTMAWSHVVTWWIHTILVFGFIAWAPYTKLMHVVTAPLNILLADPEPVARLRPIDFETSQSFGVNRLEQFTWKDLLDFDACTECGRCTAVCPAHSVGKLLSPRDIILDLQHRQRSENGHWKSTPRSEESAATASDGLINSSPAVSEEALWQCTTCAACVEACPVAIQQLGKILDLRRFLVMEEASFPPMLQEALTSLEERGHPFPGVTFSRLDWTADLDIPLASSGAPFDVLLWVGCAGALVERNQKSTRALAQLLQKAGVRFAVLGREEKCTGDPARRIGNEFLFESLAHDNIETFARYGVQQIVTACPHCYHTFANEYPRLGLKASVEHHTTCLARLIQQGRLRVDARYASGITLHDPCYLARHNGIVDAPRAVIQEIGSRPMREMSQHGCKAFCCGGGGGLSFVEEPAGQRVNQARARQAVATGADMVAVACPFCMTMMEDGLGAVAQGKTPQVKDIAELLLDGMPARTG